MQMLPSRCVSNQRHLKVFLYRLCSCSFNTDVIPPRVLCDVAKMSTLAASCMILCVVLDVCVFDEVDVTL